MLKWLLLAMVNAFALFAVGPLITFKSWYMLGFLVFFTVLIDIVFFAPSTVRWVPPKYILPGLVLLVGFVIIPIIYTTLIAFTNYGTGHALSKPDAIKTIQATSLIQPDNGDTYSVTVARDAHRHLVLLLTSQTNQKAYIGTTAGLTPVPKGAGKRNSDGVLVSLPGYTTLSAAEVNSLGDSLLKVTVPTKTGFIQMQAADVAVDLVSTLKYDPKHDVMIDTQSRTVYVNNGKGEFVNPKLSPHNQNYALQPGWRTWVGFRNFTSLLTNPQVSGPFLQVFVWNFVYALLSVLTTFLVGLGLALTLNFKIRGRRAYRSILILPYAIPAFLSTLVWAALLNDRYGAINTTLHLSIPWLSDPFWAKVSILLVNLWLGIPYMFLVSTGALQSIPSDLTEAAAVDGAKPRQAFRRVTLPLLLVALGPLLVSSFAYNFNNFNLIYLLTGGGPPMSSGTSVAGTTDILISYTYKLAFTSAQGTNYGLASAVSILIFFIVATFSLVAFSRTRVLEDVNR